MGSESVLVWLKMITFNDERKKRKRKEKGTMEMKDAYDEWLQWDGVAIYTGDVEKSIGSGMHKR